MKQLFDPEDIERKNILMLKILNESPVSLGARIIARKMQEHGIQLSERTVRYHLKLMDERGLTRLVGRRDGRVITDLGLEEIANARVQDKISLSISRIDVLSFKTTFNLRKKRGRVPVNISFIPEDKFKQILSVMKPVFQKKLAVSDRIAVARANEKLGEVVIPEGKIGLATVCSIVINGVLLKHGIPIDSKFGGILQLKNGKPLRFVELIHYSGSSLDPSEIFIRGKMTSVKEVIEKNEGKILANFREIPALSRSLVTDVIAEFREAGINGILSIGDVGTALGQTNVDINKVGMILIGGLNPIAAAYEDGFDVENKAMSTVMEFEELQSIEQM
ncbi:MAG: Ribonuclease R winged-helix domain protein [Deltaproteobacteria bacterium ADurb.BinA014]|nr:MAG: Ribonuclease R winged-helix domain protein [Deltaproteobacteria bacterium ADurb.BinA014]HNV65420.1 NrpR regulatory domain-containing protein [Smithellaceae bacterium]